MSSLHLNQGEVLKHQCYSPIISLWF